MGSDDYYYRVLGVRPSATDLELKRAYRHKAVVHHPDKNLDDPQAAAKFQAVGEAYQVLSDPALRRIYDERGRAGIKEGDRFVNPVALFSKIFGGDSFEPWVGELSLIKNIIERMELEARQRSERDTKLEELDRHAPRVDFMLENGQLNEKYSRSDNMDNFHAWKRAQRRHINSSSEKDSKVKMGEFEDTRNEKKAKRLDYMTKRLLERLAALPRRASKSETDDFIFTTKLERDSLRLESFGIPLIRTISSIYRARATAFNDFCSWSYLGSAYHYSKDVWGGLGDAVIALKAANEATTAIKLAPKPDVEDGDDFSSQNTREYDSLRPIPDLDDAKKEEIEKLVAGKVLSMAWETTKIELRGILKAVCDHVLYDEAASIKERSHRAKTLLKIADIFDQVKELDDGLGEQTFELLVLDASKVKAADLIEEVKSKSAKKEGQIPRTQNV